MPDAARKPATVFLIVAKSSHLMYILLGLLVAVNISNIFRLETLPFTDLPNHIAEAEILKDSIGDRIYSDYYRARINAVSPNILHVLFCSAFRDSEAGTRYFYSLFIILMPVSMVLLIRRSGGNSWFSVLSIALLFNYSTMWGFTGFTMAIPLCILTFTAAQSYFIRQSPMRGMLLAACILLLFYAHALVFIFFLVSIVAAVFVDRAKSIFHRLMCLAPLAPALAVFVLWVSTASEFDEGESILSFLVSYYRSEYMNEALDRLSAFFWHDCQGIAIGHARKFPLILPLAIVLPLAFSWKANSMRHLIDTVQRRQLVTFTAAALICYLLLPSQVPGLYFLYPRFSVFSYIGIISCASILSVDRRRRAAGLFAIVCAALFSLLWFNYFTEFRQWSQGVSEVLKGRNREKSLSAVIADDRFRGMPTIIHYNNYHIIWNKGVAATCLIDYPFAIIERSVTVEKLPEYSAWINDDTDYGALLSRYDGFDLLLSYGEKPFAMLSRESLWDLIEVSGKWALFEREK
jgi:hypothetical protein